MNLKNVKLAKKIKPNIKEPKKTNFKGRKHKWGLDEYGDVDVFAYESGNHNGPRCVICGFTFCHHCNPEWYEDTSCDYKESYDKYTCESCRVNEYNKKVDAINHYLKTGKII